MTSPNASTNEIPYASSPDAHVTLLLVHGAFHSAASWRRLLVALADRGIRAAAVDLPGHGNDRCTLADLTGDAARVAAQANSLAGPVVLVGHSYGGAVIAEAVGACPAVIGCVFIAGFALLKGESIIHVRPDLPVQPAELPEIAMLGPDVGVVAPASARRLFYHDCNDDDATEALRHLAPQRMSALAEGPTTNTWQSHQSAYVVCTDDRAVSPVLQEHLAGRTTRTYRIQGSHSPFASRPGELAQLLERVISDLATPSPATTDT